MGVDQILAQAAIAAVPVILGWLLVTFRRFSQRTQRIEEMWHFMQSELRPNGGSSLKDQVTQIRDAQKEMRNDFKEHIQFHLEQQDRRE